MDQINKGKDKDKDKVKVKVKVKDKEDTGHHKVTVVIINSNRFITIMDQEMIEDHQE